MFLHQRFLGPLAVGDVAPNAMIDLTCIKIDYLRGYMNMPYFTTLGAVARFKAIVAIPHYRPYVRFCLFSSFIRFYIRQSQLGKFIPRITQLATNLIIEIEGSGGFRVQGQNAIHPVLEKGTIIAFRRR